MPLSPRPRLVGGAVLLLLLLRGILSRAPLRLILDVLSLLLALVSTGISRTPRQVPR